MAGGERPVAGLDAAAVDQHLFRPFRAGQPHHERVAETDVVGDHADAVAGAARIREHALRARQPQPNHIFTEGHAVCFEQPVQIARRKPMAL